MVLVVMVVGNGGRKPMDIELRILPLLKPMGQGEGFIDEAIYI